MDMILILGNKIFYVNYNSRKKKAKNGLIVLLERKSSMFWWNNSASNGKQSHSHTLKIPRWPSPMPILILHPSSFWIFQSRKLLFLLKSTFQRYNLSLKYNLLKKWIMSRNYYPFFSLFCKFRLFLFVRITAPRCLLRKSFIN